MRRLNVINITVKIFTFGFFLFCSSNTSWAASTKVIGFGDSITAGWPYITTDQNGSTVGGYEPSLQTLLSNFGWDVSVLNYGHPGELSSDGERRIQSMLDAQEPDWVLILDGTNDLWWVSTNSVMDNLASMVEKVRAEGRHAVLATLTPDTRGGKPISQMNEKIRAWTDTNQVPLADQYAAVAADWDSLNCGDELHPNTEGYKVMANTWFDAIITHSNRGKIAPVLMLLLQNN